jgi:ribosomal protein S15P/S13E
MKPIIRKRMSFSPDAWRSVEAAVPIALEETTLVLGLSEEDEPLRSYLETQTMAALIREILLELTGKEMNVLVIPGTTEDDWKRYKSRQEYQKRLAAQVTEATVRQVKEHRDWMWLSNQIAHAHAHLSHRQYDFVKAQFLLDWAGKIAKFVEEFLTSHPQGRDEVTRELERLCQRMSGMLNTSALVVGLEIERAIRARRQKGEGSE